MPKKQLANEKLCAKKKSTCKKNFFPLEFSARKTVSKRDLFICFFISNDNIHDASLRILPFRKLRIKIDAHSEQPY